MDNLGYKQYGKAKEYKESREYEAVFVWVQAGRSRRKFDEIYESKNNLKQQQWLWFNQ